MREYIRIERILNLLREVWTEPLYQDQRFGQMLCNLGVIERQSFAWFTEDDKLEKGLEKYIRKLKGGKDKKKNGKKKK